MLAVTSHTTPRPCMAPLMRPHGRYRWLCAISLTSAAAVPSEAALLYGLMYRNCLSCMTNTPCTRTLEARCKLREFKHVSD